MVDKIQSIVFVCGQGRFEISKPSKYQISICNHLMLYHTKLSGGEEAGLLGFVRSADARIHTRAWPAQHVR